MNDSSSESLVEDTDEEMEEENDDDDESEDEANNNSKPNKSNNKKNTVEGKVNLDNITLNLIDTAGIRDSKDTVEKIGIEKAKEAYKNADLIIHVIDASNIDNEDKKRIMKLLLEEKELSLLQMLHFIKLVELLKKDYQEKELKAF